MSHSSISTSSHHWDPLDVLKIHWTGQCIGWADTQRRQCRNAVNRFNRPIFDSVIRDLATQPLDAVLLGAKLQELARIGLCLRRHQPQQEKLVQKWTTLINARSAELETAARRRGTVVTTTTALSPTAQPVSSNRYTPTISPQAQSEAESLQRSIDALSMQVQAARQRLECLLTPESPGLVPSRITARVQSTEVPSLGLSRTPSDTLGASLVRHERSPPSSPVRDAQSTITRASAVSASLRESTLSSSPTEYSTLSSSPPRLHLSVRPTALSSTSTEPSPSRSSAPLTQGADISLEAPPDVQPGLLIQPQSHAPSEPETIPSCSRTHTRRIPLSDSCPICYNGPPLFLHPASSLICCTSSCGRTVHKSCFDTWAAQCTTSGLEVICPVCRADWDESCACGGRSSCTSVHAERREKVASCPVCREDMGDAAVNELQWCKDGCGQNVHKACMDTWTEHCNADAEMARCTMCRAEWVSSCSC